MRVHLDSQALLAQLDSPVTMLQVLLVPQEPQVPQERQEKLELQAKLVLMVHQVLLGPQVLLVLLVLLELLACSSVWKLLQLRSQTLAEPHHKLFKLNVMQDSLQRVDRLFAPRAVTPTRRGRAQSVRQVLSALQ